MSAPDGNSCRLPLPPGEPSLRSPLPPGGGQGEGVLATPFRYPCTGPTETKGFGDFLEQNLSTPRANLRAFAAELRATFNLPPLTLTNSGSSANLAAALALAEKTGRGHAITAGFTFPTTLNALVTAGYDVTLVDTERFCMSPEALANAIRPDTKLVCFTDFLGFEERRAECFEIAREKGIAILEDACERVYREVPLPLPPPGGRGSPRGEFALPGGRGSPRGELALPGGRGSPLSPADLVTLSFYHPHHLSAFGGGAVVAADDSLRRIVESVAHWGRRCSCHTLDLPCDAPHENHFFLYIRPGHNLEMSELNAAFGRFQLRSWPAQEARRKDHYARLFAALQGRRAVRVEPPPEDASPFVFPIEIVDGDVAAISRRLASRGVETRTLMGGAIADQPGWQHAPGDGLARARTLASRSFFVGVHQTLPPDDVADVARILGEELPG